MIDIPWLIDRHAASSMRLFAFMPGVREGLLRMRAAGMGNDAKPA
jgi:hypothetical protein